MSDRAKDQTESVTWAVKRYQGPLITQALRITGDLELAREVVQDTFLRFCGHRQKILNGRLSAWLFTVCRNRALDVVAKERRSQPVEDLNEWVSDDRQESPRQIVSRRDSLALVKTLIDGLTEREREIIRYKFEHGLSYREIGDALELTEGNVGYLLHQALQKIRKRYGAKESASRSKTFQKL